MPIIIADSREQVEDMAGRLNILDYDFVLGSGTASELSAVIESACSGVETTPADPGIALATREDVEQFIVDGLLRVARCARIKAGRPPLREGEARELLPAKCFGHTLTMSDWQAREIWRELRGALGIDDVRQIAVPIAASVSLDPQHVFADGNALADWVVVRLAAAAGCDSADIVALRWRIAGSQIEDVERRLGVGRSQAYEQLRQERAAVGLRHLSDYPRVLAATFGPALRIVQRS